ncbi:hypothetical protein P885DRAFT_62492 [Corynascus similis CBS 632.67]
MAEVLAVAGGIAAIIQLAGCGKKLARVLHRFSRDVMDARDSVQRFANQVGIFSAVIEAAQQTISWYCRDNPESLLVTYINSSGLLASINLEAGIVRQHLRDIRNQVLHMKSTFVFWASIMWGIKKSSFKEVLPEMESIKTSLILLLSTTRLESLISTLEADNQTPEESLGATTFRAQQSEYSYIIIELGTPGRAMAGTQPPFGSNPDKEGDSSAEPNPGQSAATQRANPNP